MSSNIGKLLLIRGLPGSGKSTLARQLIAFGLGDDHWEADMFFQKGDLYEYNPSMRDAAHNWCVFNVIKSLKDGKDTIVSNTFTRKWEIDNYVDKISAAIPSVEFKVMTISCCKWKSIHDVPDATIENMRSRWEPYPNEFIVAGIRDFYDEETISYCIPGG